MNSKKFIEEYQELTQQAKKYYNKNVKDKLEELEKTRISYILLIIWLYFLVTLLMYLFIKTCIIDEQILIWIITSLLGILLIIVYALIPRFINALFYKEKIKKIYSLLLIPFNLQYMSNTVSKNIQYCIDNSKLCHKSNKIYSDDRFVGNYNDVDIEIAEINVTKDVVNIGNLNNNPDLLFHIDSDNPTFKGCAITFNSNKTIKALTHIRPKMHSLKLFRLSYEERLTIICCSLFIVLGAGSILYEVLINKQYLMLFGIPIMCCPLLFLLAFYQPLFRKKRNKKQKFQKVELEDIVFSKDYDVYSYDQIESRYLLTTAFIERFLFLQKVFNTKNICCAFVEDQILLLISSKKNLFEIGNLFTSLKNKKYVEKFYDEIIAILLLVNHFKLNEHTGL